MKTTEQQFKAKVERLAAKIFVARLHKDMDAKVSANAAISLATQFYLAIYPPK